MKKLISLLLATVLLASSALVWGAELETNEEDQAQQGQNQVVASVLQNNPLSIEARSWILVSMEEDPIILAASPGQTAMERMPMASITKIMTLLITFEKLDAGEIALTDMVTVSKDAADLAVPGSSNIALTTGEQISVEDLIKGVVIKSGNDAAQALAEYISGNVTDFVALMNQRAQELGMVNTQFMNPHGLDTDGHYSCARDIAVMSLELMKHEKILEYTKMGTTTIRNGTFTIKSTNDFAHGTNAYEGATGLKTGHTPEAGYCLSATAQRGNMKLLTVVMGTADATARDAQTVKLMDYGFNNFEMAEGLGEGVELDAQTISGGTVYNLQPVVESTKECLLPAGRQGDLQQAYEPVKGLKAPIQKGDVMGSIIYRLDGQELARVDAVAPQDVPKMTFGFAFRKLLDMLLMRPAQQETQQTSGDVKTSDGAQPSTSGAQTSGGAQPSTSDAQTSGETQPSTSGAQTSGGTQPSTSDVQTSGDTQPSTSGAQTSQAA